MSFKEKVDYFSLADAGNLVLVSAAEGRTAQVVEAQGQDGSVVASEVFGETRAPSCEYKLKAAYSSAAGALKLGGVSSVTSEKTPRKFALVSISISTGAGAEPTLSASGEQVEDGATDGCVYGVPAFSLETKHHAQILFGAFSVGGEGCHLTQADYGISAELAKATKDGECLAFDVTNGRIEASLTVKQCGANAPTITPGEGWKITAPLSETNPDSDYPTFAATLVKYLAKADAE